MKAMRPTRNGAADTLVVPGPADHEVFSRRGANEPYRLLVEAMHEGAAMLVAGTIAFCNSRFAEIVGIPLDQIIGTPVDRLVASGGRLALESLVANASKYPGSIAMTFVSAGGAQVLTQISASAVDVDGSSAVVLIVTDVSKLLDAEQAQNEKRFQGLVETSSDWIWETDSASHFTYSSPQVMTLLGYAPAELLGKGPVEFVIPEEREALANAVQERLAAPQSIAGFLATMIAKDGRRVIVEVNIVPTFDLRGKFLGDHGTIRDVTARSELETLQRTRSFELSEAQRIGAMGSFTWTFATGNLGWSDGLKRLLRLAPGVPAPTFDGLAKFYTPEGWERLMASAAKAVDTVGTDAVEAEMIREDGTTLWTLMRGEAVRGPDGSVVAIRGTVHDIDARKRAEKAAEHEHHFNQAIIDSLPGLFYLLDQRGNFLRWNKNLETVSGYSAEELQRKSVLELFPESSRARLAERMGEVFSAGQAEAEAMLVAKDQTQTPFVFSGSRFLLDGRECIIGLGLDITERTAADAGLRLQAAALNAAANAIAIIDRTGTVAWINAAFTALTGYNADEAVGRNPRELFKSGVHDQAFYKHLWDTVLAGNVWHGELTNRRKDGSRYAEEQTITPVTNVSGEVTHFIAVKRDLTQQRQLEAQVAQGQRMEALGTLAGGIAHDFNNILGAMLGSTELAAMDAEGNDAVLESLAGVTAAGRRATELVQHILAFSGRKDAVRKPLRLQPVISEAVALLRASLPASVELRTAFDPDALVVLANPTEVHQIVMNLGINAWHAMKDRPGLIEMGLDVVEANTKLIGPRSGRCMRFSVRDTGQGMSPGTLARIFEPFFTTKAPGKGTGLGLATVHGIMRSCGGEISVSSQPGIGTTFELYFPVVDDASTVDAVGDDAVPRGSGQHILVVDDEPSLVAWATAALERLGYRATGQVSAAAALAAVAEDVHFDLVLTDLTMPAMTGFQFADRVRAVHPDMPVIFATGYSTEMSESMVQRYGKDAFLQKPANFKTLAQAVDRELRRRA